MHAPISGSFMRAIDRYCATLPHLTRMNRSDIRPVKINCFCYQRLNFYVEAWLVGPLDQLYQLPLVLWL